VSSIFRPPFSESSTYPLGVADGRNLDEQARPATSYDIHDL
jgi:hypothetical protein